MIIDEITIRLEKVTEGAYEEYNKYLAHISYKGQKEVVVESYYLKEMGDLTGECPRDRKIEELSELFADLMWEDFTFDGFCECTGEGIKTWEKIKARISEIHRIFEDSEAEEIKEFLEQEGYITE